MKVIKKKIKKPVMLAILAGALALLIAAALIISAVIKANGGASGEPKDPPEVDKTIGEDIYKNNAVAYPYIKNAQIELVEITGGDGDGHNFGFMWDDDFDDYVLFKDEENGTQSYLPPILLEDFGEAEYSDFYASENDGMKIRKLTALLSAIGTVIFDDKDKITATNEAARQEELAVYGLSDADNPIKVSFWYDSDGDSSTADTKQHELVIGNQLISGQGYYFMVDGRDWVYITNGTSLSYTLLKYTDYINPLLVAPGVAADKAFEPYLTTDYKQWKHELFDKNGDIIKEDATVIVGTNIYTPKYGDDLKNIINGYLIESNTTYSFDLKSLSSTSGMKKIVDILKGQAVGSLPPLPVTFYTYSNVLSFDAAQTLKYTYTVSAVEAIVSDSGIDETQNGTIIGASDILRVTYKLEGDEAVRHGVIDLTSSLIPDSAKNALIGTALGDEISVTFDIDYTEATARKIDSKIVIDEIIGIRKDGKITDTVSNGATVKFNYTLITGEVTQKGTMTIEITDELSGIEKLVADALIGKKLGDELDTELEYSTFYEEVADFVTYEITSVNCFYIKKPIASFEFVQATDRDPFYGESLYKNTLENEYKLYAINSSSCEIVLKIIGGLLDNATTSTGLQGSRVVDINITPDKLQKYGLLANSIYFELPRYITAVSSGDTVSGTTDYLTSLDNYSYYGTLGVTLHISDVQFVDGEKVRYIASDLYNVIAVIDGDMLDKFTFIDQSFTEFFARRNLVITDVANISNIKMEFNLSDFFGKYNSRLDHNWGYLYNGKSYKAEDLTPEQLAVATKYDFIDIMQSVYGEHSQTVFSELLSQSGKNAMTLRELYDGEKIQLDSIGTDHFKSYIAMLFATEYTGVFTKEEMEGYNNFEDIVAAGSYLLKMTVSLGEVENYPYDYVYEFYRVSDRRVMVRIYKTDVKTGVAIDEPLTDFYISSGAFEKIAASYRAMLNKEGVDGEVPYP